MAPKAAPAAQTDETPEQEAERLASARLLETARNSGMLSRTRRMCLKPAEPSKVLLKADGKDITKKSSVRKNRFLLMFSASIDAKAHGKLGTLCHLDSRNPVMYVDFPEGRLKFMGTLVFPTSTKYLMLKLNPKDILCEDVFESLVVFSEARWIGTKEENPEELELPMPDSLSERRIHEDVSFGDAMMAPAAAGGQAVPVSSGAEEEEEEVEPPEQASRPQSSRAAARAAHKVLGANLSDEEEDGASSDEGGVATGKKDGAAAQGPLSQVPASQSSAAGKELCAYSKLMAGSRAKASPKKTKAAPASTSAKAKPSRAATASGGSSRKRKLDDSGDSDDSGDDPEIIEIDTSPQPSSSSRPKRRAAAQKKVEYKEMLSSEGDEDEDESD